MPFYKPRGLPHWDPEDASLFVTWRLYGSLPAPEPEWEVLPPGKQFVQMDQALERNPKGPQWLANPAVAQCVAAALHYGETELHLCQLHAWVIMSNHVHILISPRALLARIMHSIKTFSAREANQVLGRTGQPFWQQESYDRWVRNAQEFDKIVRYIEENPVKAGLVENPQDWPWSSVPKVGREADGTRL